MNDKHAEGEGNRAAVAVLKVLYLLAVTTIVFAVPSVRFFRPWRWQIVAGIAAVQILTLLICRVSAAEVLRATTRLKWFFAFLFLCYGLLPGEYGGRHYPLLATSAQCRRTRKSRG